MYVTPRFPFDPLMLTCLGFLVFGFGVLLMIEAGRASARGAPASMCERDGRIGVKSCLLGIVLLIAAAVWAVLK